MPPLRGWMMEGDSPPFSPRFSSGARPDSDSFSGLEGAAERVAEELPQREESDPQALKRELIPGTYWHG